MKRERDIPTAEEQRNLAELSALVSKLQPDRGKQLMHELHQQQPIDLPALPSGASFYTLRDLETAYQLSRKTLLRYIESGALRATRIGRAYRVSSEAVREWLAQYQDPR